MNCRTLAILLVVGFASPASAQQRFAQLVKTPFTYVVRAPSGYDITSMACTPYAGTAPRQVNYASPTEPRYSSARLEYVGLCPYYDTATRDLFTGQTSAADGYRDYVFNAYFGSLWDVRYYDIQCNGKKVQRGKKFWDKIWEEYRDCCRQGCQYCDPQCEEDIQVTFLLNVYNFPASISSMTVPATATCPGRIPVQAQASDSDGTWAPFPLFTWTATGPGGASASFVGASGWLDITRVGTWQVRLDVDDDEGERTTQTRSVTATAGPFTSTVSGATSVPVLRVPIALQVASNACGTPTTTWDIVSAPPRAHLQPKTAYATGPSLTIVTTTDGDIGAWTFRAMTVLGAYSDVKTYTVEVTNLPPRYDLATTGHVLVGEPVRLETKILDDDDGGALTFDWKLLQAPASAGVVPGAGFSTGPVVTFPTTAASAGTWVFELTVTDDDGASNSTVKTSPVTVLVDALPVANVSGPAYVETWSPVTLDGSASLDPDSPCPDDPMRCHVTTSGLPQGISAGITSYAWSVTPPMELWWRYPPGRVDDALLVDATGARLQLDGLEAGDWVFALDVVDGEGNAAHAEIAVTVLPPDLPPVVILSPPARYVVSVGGNVTQPIVVSGAASYDPDNFARGGGPGAGITARHWNLSPPAGCVYGSMSFDGPETLTLYPAGAIVPPACQGVWTVGLTATDDDSPARTASGSTAVVIGNCDGVLCIDAPTTAAPRVVEAWDHTDVTVVYHLDSALYDRPEFAYGMMTELELFVAGDTTFPVYTSLDPNVIASNKADLLAFNWNGYSRLGLAVVPGFYDVRVRLLDWTGLPPADPAYSDLEPQAIWMEVAQMTASNAGSAYASRDALEAGAASLAVAYEAVGALSVDELRWRVRDASGAIVHEQSDPGSLAGTVRWNGRTAAGVAPAGRYTVEVEAYRTSQLLASSGPVAVTIVSVDLVVAGAPDADLLVWVNQDDDDLDGVPDANEGASALEDDLASVAVVVSPPLAGTVTLTGATPAGATRFWSSVRKDGAVTAPWSVTLTAGAPSPELVVEGLAPARAAVALSFTTADGVALSFTRTIDQAELRLVGGEFAPAPFVEIARWDNAYDWSSGIWMVRNWPGRPDLVELDPRRFYVEITDPGANDPAAADAIGAEGTPRWVTIETRGRVQDAPVRVSLTEQGSDASGVLRSLSQFLVTEDHQSPRLDAIDPDRATDDAYEVTAGSLPVVDNAPDDRTHQADVSGVVRVMYHRGGATPEHAVSVPVCARGAADARRRAVLQPVVLWDPLRNDWSVDEGFVQAEVTRAILSWQQACIQVVARPTTYAHAPIDPATGDDRLLDGYLDNPADARALYDAWKPPSQNFLYVFFVPDFRGGRPAFAFTAIPSAQSWLGNDTVAFIRRVGADHRVRALAHELGHVLENADRDGLLPAPYASEFYPAAQGIPDENVLSFRRITDVTETRCRTPRTQPTGVGNVLLQPY